MSGALSYVRGLRNGADWASLDTETTGLGPYDVVVEVAVIGSNGEPLFNSLARPGRPVQVIATAVHGLTESMLQDAPAWPTLWPTLQNLLRNTTILAWNAAFDLRLLRQTCDRHDLAFQSPHAACLRQAFLEQHPHVRGSLQAACLTLGLASRPNHRAGQDAEVARQVALALMGTEEAVARGSGSKEKGKGFL